MPGLIDIRLQKHCRPRLHSPGAPRILCVDDDLDIHTAFALKMRAYDVELERAFHGMQGISEAVNGRPDLILMDLAMPNGNGRYVVDCIKSNRATAAIPIIVVTGIRDPALRSQLLTAGVAVYLHKPVSFDELLHNINCFVEIRKRSDEQEPQ